MRGSSKKVHDLILKAARIIDIVVYRKTALRAMMSNQGTSNQQEFMRALLGETSGKQSGEVEM